MTKFRNKTNFDSCGKCTCFGSTYNKIGTIQRRLAWPLRKDDTQNREAFLIFFQGNIAKNLIRCLIQSEARFKSFILNYFTFFALYQGFYIKVFE